MPPRLGNTTLLAYFFWDDERIDTQFYAIECSYLCAFYRFGLLPSVLVTNRATRLIEKFCETYGVKLDLEPQLSGGGIRGMSYDCIKNLHRRFDTDYVLIIQTDGVPVNGGLDRFIGRYDYVGAPFGFHTSWRRRLPYAKYRVGNGGFSLRSKKICERAALLYGRYFPLIPYNWFMVEDIFYSCTLRCLFPAYRAEFAFPEPEIAGTFSVESNPAFLHDDLPPVGFHAECGFQIYKKKYGVPFSEMLSE